MVIGEYIDLKRFTQAKFWGIQRFLPDKPASRLLDMDAVLAVALIHLY